MGGGGSKDKVKSNQGQGQGQRVSRAEARAAWQGNNNYKGRRPANGYNHGSPNGKMTMSQRIQAKKFEKHDDTLGQTTYNLFDIGNNHHGDDENDLSRPNRFNDDVDDRFSNFRDITRDRVSNKENSYGRGRKASPERHTRKRGSPRRFSKLKPRSPPAPRRSSDVSTIDMKVSPEHFRNVRNPRHKSDIKQSPTKRKSKPKRRSRSSSPPRGRKAGSKRSNSKQRGSRKNDGYRSRSFTNIANVKSASNSLDSAVSNFDMKTGVERFHDKGRSLRDARLHKLTTLRNQILDQKTNGEISYHKAVDDLVNGDSEDWKKKVKGLEVIITLSRKRPEILTEDLKQVLRIMMDELRNLRSQVCRTAGQGFAELFYNLGKDMELNLDKTTPLLLQKAADTNKFMRESCSEALDAMVENVSVYKGLMAVSLGNSHKSVVVRTNVARLFDKVVTQLGPERLMGSSGDLQDLVIQLGSKLITDSSQEVRNHAKHMFAGLKGHKKFDGLMIELLTDDERKNIRKVLNSR